MVTHEKRRLPQAWASILNTRVSGGGSQPGSTASGCVLLPGCGQGTRHRHVGLESCEKVARPGVSGVWVCCAGCRCACGIQVCKCSGQCVGVQVGYGGVHRQQAHVRGAVCTCVRPPLLHGRPRPDPERLSNLPPPQPPLHCKQSHFPKSMFLITSLEKPPTAPHCAMGRTVRTCCMPRRAPADLPAFPPAPLGCNGPPCRRLSEPGLFCCSISSFFQCNVPLSTTN